MPHNFDRSVELFQFEMQKRDKNVSRSKAHAVISGQNKLQSKSTDKFTKPEKRREKVNLLINAMRPW